MTANMKPAVDEFHGVDHFGLNKYDNGKWLGLF
jgi:hypothetical protein